MGMSALMAQDWRVVTADAAVPPEAVLESLLEVAVESSVDVSADVLVLESSVLVALEDASADDDEPTDVETAACWEADDDVVVPMEPS
jgi:hypothetical protein